MAKIEQRDALDVLTKPRLVAIADAVGLDLPARLPKADLVDAIAHSQRAPFPRVLGAARILGGRPDGGSVTLTKAELAEDVAASGGLLKRDAELIVNAMLEAMTESLRSGSPIEIRGFGSFRIRDRAARIGRNPRTGAKTKIPPKRVCYFRPGKALSEIVNS